MYCSQFKSLTALSANFALYLATAADYYYYYFDSSDDDDFPKKPISLYALSCTARPFVRIFFSLNNRMKNIRKQ